MSSLDGPIVLCFSILDEADIAEDFLEYHLSVGVEGFVAVDVGSTDGTLDILRRYERTGRLRLISRGEPTAQGKHWLDKMVALAREAFRPSWFLFCDSDEFWVFPEEDAVAYLAAAPAPILTFPRFNMLPSPGAAPGEAVSFREFDLVVRRPLQFLYDLARLNQPGGAEWSLNAHPPDILRFVAPKVLARADVFHAVKPGFHDVEPIAPTVPRHIETRGYVAHFQVRDTGRFMNKARRVADFIEENPPGADQNASRHWVRLATLYRHGLAGAEYARQILGPAYIALCLEKGIAERDPRIANRLARLNRRTAA
jgi:glycosyltransferase involved in cell wall biosynthesis